jgi:formiminotetrahydrofolate cyclodeaminase
MLAALTTGKKGYEAVWSEMDQIFERARQLKDDMLDLLQRDTEAFDDASRAFKMPRNTDKEKKKRTEAIEAGLVKASEVPLGIMEKSLEVARLARQVLKKGNEMAITDGAISALFAESAAIGGMINARINFSWMKNEDYIRKTEHRLDEILDEIRDIKEEAISYTLEKLKK